MCYKNLYTVNCCTSCFCWLYTITNTHVQACVDFGCCGSCVRLFPGHIVSHHLEFLGFLVADCCWQPVGCRHCASSVHSKQKHKSSPNSTTKDVFLA